MMYGIKADERRKRIDEVLKLVDLTDKAAVLVEKYSGGMKRRLEIARGLIQRPKVLFLDEPTLGLDAQTRRHIWDYVKKLNREGRVTIILTTHYMEEADYLCDRIAIMDHGKFVALDTPPQLKDVLGGDVVSLEVEGRSGASLAELRKPWIGSRRYSRTGRGLNLTMEKGERRIPELITLAQRSRRDGRAASTSASRASRTSSSISPAGRSASRRRTPSERNRAMMMGHGRR